MKVLKRLLKILAYALATLVVLIALVVVLSQTSFFKNRLRIILVSALSTKLNGTLQIGHIDGNFLNGFTIDSIAIYSGDTVVVAARKISCQYDPLTLLNKQLSMNYLIVEQPTIHLTRSLDGIWNIDKLIKPSEDTTKAGAFEWVLNFNDIELKNGTITVEDTAALAEPTHWNMPEEYVEYHKFSINDLNVKLSASIKQNNFRAQLTHASFYSPQSKFELVHTKGDFTLTEKGISTTNVIVQTSGSYVEIDARLTGANIFNGVSLQGLEHDSTQLQLRATNLDLRELRSFIPQVSFLDGSALIDLDARGEFGNLLVNHLHIRTLGSTLNISGSVRHLERPHELYLDLLLGDTKINPPDVSKVLLGLNLPRFDAVGPMSIFSEYHGTPLNFRTKSLLKGQFGSIDFSGGMDLEQHPPTYNLTLATNNLKLESVFKSSNFHTFLSGRGTLVGQGFSVKDIAATLNMTIDSSSVDNVRLTASTISARATPSRIDGTVALNSQDAKVYAQAWADFNDMNRPRYGGNFSLTSLDLSQILNEPRYQSNLTLTGTATIDGRNIDDLNADLTLSLQPSIFRGQELSGEDVHLVLDQRNPGTKRLKLQSSVADVNIGGRFDIDLSTATIVHQATNLIDAIRRHSSIDTTAAEKIPSKLIVRPHTRAQQIMDFQYSVDVKSLESIGNIFASEPLNAKGRIVGSVNGDMDRLFLTCKGTIDEFFIGTVKSGILLSDGTVDLRVDSLSDSQTLEHLATEAHVTIGSGKLNTLSLSGLKANAQYKNLDGQLSAAGVVDSAYGLRMIGSAAVQPHTYAIDLDSLVLSTGNYLWHNDQDVQFRINDEGIRVMHAVMRRNGEALSASGLFQPGGTVEVNASLRKFNLGSLGLLLRDKELSQPGQSFTGSADADLQVNGTMEAPILSFTVIGDSICYRQTPIGFVNGRMNYRDQIAALDVTVKRAITDAKPTLTIKGTLPINLALSGVADRFPDESQNVQVLSEGFDVNVLGPFLPDFANLSGTLTCNVTLAGTPKSPDLGGSINLTDVQFLLVPNNVSYILNGDLEPASDRINVRRLVVRNAPEKNLQGEATISGALTMKNFQITAFDLLATGDVLLMTEASRKSIPSMYGTLFVEIGSEGLKIQGSLQRPFLAGHLFIREANLIFPPTKARTMSNNSLTLKYVSIDDTSKTTQRGPQRSRFFGPSESTEVAANDNGSMKESPLLERLRYNLALETRGTTSVRMIFTPATNEELFAKLDGKVDAINEQGTPSIYGEISIGQQSYYQFFKKFDATGKLRFVGPWDNPELDINATYEAYGRVPEETSTTAQIAANPQPTPSSSTSNEQKKVIVELHISGTRNEPKLAISMKVQKSGSDYVDWKGSDVQADAISFIVFGKFRDELTSADRSGVGSTASQSIVAGAASSLLSGPLTDLMQKEFPFIRSAEVSYGGGSIQEGADVRVTAEVSSGYLRVGGKIFNDIGNTNVTYQVSLGEIFKANSIRNLFIELNRQVEASNTFSGERTTTATSSARLYYRFSF